MEAIIFTVLVKQQGLFLVEENGGVDTMFAKIAECSYLTCAYGASFQ